MNASRKKILDHYNATFLEAKNNLNAKQLEAVEEIYGPVMTIAGPGTGKTQLLAVRIGNILQKTDANIKEILCLTYTEAGAIEMKERLKRFIGPEAHNANIFTNHGFCNYFIQQNIEYFGGYRNLQVVSDLELVDVYRKLIDDLAEDHPLKRLKNDIYYNKSKLEKLFTVMKQEGWTSEFIEEKINALRAYYHEVDESGEYIHREYICKRKSDSNIDGRTYYKGDIRDDKIEEEIKSFDGLIAGANLLPKYDELLKIIERFDYNDMIMWVVDVLKKNPDLLASYQERFQFFLVDEYQDNNGIQNELLYILSASPFGEPPNIFIVGDDDQSIFRFQGANMNNIIDFAERFDPLEIILGNNYRSHQAILDKATALINNNNERVVVKRPHLTKNLIASRQNKSITAPPEVKRFKNAEQEEWWIINDILTKNKNGVSFKDMAIIYRSHKDIENIAKYCSYHGIPINLKKTVNVLKQTDVKRILSIIKYIYAEYTKPFSGDHLLFEIMHFDYFGIKARDIALLSVFCSNSTDNVDDDKRWRSIIDNEVSLVKAGVVNCEQILAFSKMIEGWISAIPNMTAQMLFETILTNGNILNDILTKGDKAWRLQLINTFFNFIKDHSSRKEDLSIMEIVEMVDKMEESSLEMPLNKLLFTTEGINMMTAHRSKGLEFKHVYIIKAIDSEWVKKSNNNRKFKFPNTIVPMSEQSDVEDDRRLFYVAMTRAEDYLTITCHQYGKDEKEKMPVRFIDEMFPDIDYMSSDQVIDDDEMIAYTSFLLTHLEAQPKLIDHDLIDKVLQTFKMSTTSLNKYLKCPITFYYENILRVPMARRATNGFGNAIHLALELFFRDIETSPSREIPPVEKLINYFEFGMKKFHSHFTPKEFELSLIRGRELLSAYYKGCRETWTLPRAFLLEYKINTEYKGVPISGLIDRIDVYDDQIKIIDYKTGAFSYPKLASPKDDSIGGDYWRQMVFYKMLIQGDDTISLPMRSGTMDFIEFDDKDKHSKRELYPSEDDIDFVGKQLTESYEKIKNHEFSVGCGELTCKWCLFVNDNQSIVELGFEEEEEDGL